ncbi:MAG: hypothetical protein LBK50_03920 [Candidatus Nomurabacteria bacterium]|jgi:hypothetical protein|nr:hypothetical protein [Candidatus Nomurabacteria bacterium]
MEKIAKILSKKLDCDWTGIPQVTICPAIVPFAPRFIEQSKFLVPYYFNRNWILCATAHELTHFLYFKKLQELLGEKIDTEYPSDDWLISEIVAPIVVNSNELQKITHFEDEFSTPDKNIISHKKLKIIEKLFTDNANLTEFRNKALKEIRRED